MAGILALDVHQLEQLGLKPDLLIMRRTRGALARNRLISSVVH